MVSSCCVFGCTTRFSKESGIGFFRFPRNIIRRLEWISAVRRKNWLPNYTSRICGKHFITGRPAELTDKEHPDWIPSLNLGYEIDDYERKMKKQRRLSVAGLNGEYSKIDMKHFGISVEDVIKSMKSFCPKEKKMRNTTYLESEAAQDSCTNLSEDELDSDPLTYYVYGLNKFSYPTYNITHENALQSAKTLLMFLENQKDTDLADLVNIRHYMRKFSFIFGTVAKSIIPNEENLGSATVVKLETAQDSSTSISEDELDFDPLTYYVYGLDKFNYPACDVTHESALQSAETLLMFMQSQCDTDLGIIIIIRRYIKKIKDKIKATESWKYIM